MCGRRSRLRIHALIVRVPARGLHQRKPFRLGAISSQSRLAPPRRRPTRDGPLRQGRRSRDRPRALRGSQPRLSNIVRRISERLRLNHNTDWRNDRKLREKKREEERRERERERRGRGEERERTTRESWRACARGVVAVVSWSCLLCAVRGRCVHGHSFTVWCCLSLCFFASLQGNDRASRPRRAPCDLCCTLLRRRNHEQRPLLAGWTLSTR